MIPATFINSDLDAQEKELRFSLLSRQAFQTLREKMDPRKSNGGVFLGLNGIVIKSHGGADTEGFAAAIDMGYDMIRYELLSKISQAMARDLIQRGGIRAVEAFATTRPDPTCTTSAEFLAHVGFRTHRAHPTSPRMRMDLRSALTWKDEVEAALEKLVGIVRPATTPSPSPTTRNAPDPR